MRGFRIETLAGTAIELRELCSKSAETECMMDHKDFNTEKTVK